MAPLPSLVFISASLCMSHMAFAVNVVTNDKDSTLIRREVGAVNLDPNGKTKVTLKEFQKKAQETTQDITECDRQFVLMAEGSDDCTGSTFLQMTDSICQFAAKELSGVAVGHDTEGYFMNNTESATLDHPSDCFYNTATSSFHYNPLGAHSTNTLTGRKLCLRATYINGDPNTDSGACTTPAVPILTAEDCFVAAACAGGGEVCRMDSFQENETATERWKGELGDGVWQHVPKGCFKMPSDHATKAECWNFSPFAPQGGVQGGFMPVCKNVVQTNNEFPR